MKAKLRLIGSSTYFLPIIVLDATFLIGAIVMKNWQFAFVVLALWIVMSIPVGVLAGRAMRD